MSETPVILPKFKFWCVGCGAYDREPCSLVGHISKSTRPGGRATIAAIYLGGLRHLPVTLPEG